MELKHIAIDRLTVSRANMRSRGRAPDLTGILPSVRARGVLVPLIVRPGTSHDSYEIVAGKRRYHAALAVAAETGDAEPLPCAIMAAGDDAAALEASLIENVARLDADEVTRWDAAFDARRRAVLAILGFDADAPTLTGGYGGDHGIAGLFARLLPLSDAAVRDILAILMAETLEAGSAIVEMLGRMLDVDMAKVWQADDVLLDLIRDREVMGVILVEVAGEGVAAVNEAATAKVKRGIIRNCLAGENGRAKVEGWVPRWLRFPPSAYTDRGGVGSVERAASLAKLAVPVIAPVITPQPELLQQPA